MDEHPEFCISGAVCRVVPDGGSAEEPFSGGDGVDDDDQVVVGRILIGDRRYLVLSRRSRGSHGQQVSPRVCDLLTGRELQVAMMVSEGHGNKQIAFRLGLSEWTVTSYLRRIFAKLRVRTRAAMVARILGDLQP